MDRSVLGNAVPTDAAVATQLQNLVVDSQDVNDFLSELCNYAARAISRSMELPVVCAVTLSRRRRTTTAAWSDPQARLMDEIQQNFGAGPCLHAMHTATTVLVRDTRKDTRWPEYGHAIAEMGQLSVLAVPLTLDEDAKAALNIFAPIVNAFDSKALENAELFAANAQSALRLAVRVATGQQLAADLRAAMESRTAIDLAAGIIMGQNRCSQEEALAILVKASSGRNQKLRVVAEQIVAAISPEGPPLTHFE
jgi:AmiR/NasT family two-component response regulator